MGSLDGPGAEGVEVEGGEEGEEVREEILKVSILEPQRLIVGLGLFSWDLSARQKVSPDRIRMGGGVGDL